MNNAGHAKRIKLPLLLILLTIPVQLFISAFLCCMLIFHGPFLTVRKYVVGTAMSTFTHQYIARFFMSDAQINQLLNKGSIKDASLQNVKSVTVQHTNDTSIEEYEIKGSQYHGYLLVVKNPLRVHVANTKYLLKVGQTVSQMAKDNNAVAAINGGGFAGGSGWTGTGDRPTDFVMSGGKLIWKDPSLSVYRSCDVIALDGHGKLIVGKHSIKNLQEMNVQDAVTMPGYQPLIVNGSGVFRDDGSMNPRTAIGQRKDGSILLLVLDGRQISLPGATVLDVQNLMIDRGAYNAAMLDGGSSSTMVYNGQVINSPCSLFGERAVPTSFYVSK